MPSKHFCRCGWTAYKGMIHTERFSNVFLNKTHTSPVGSKAVNPKPFWNYHSPGDSLSGLKSPGAHHLTENRILGKKLA
jgi:hypothetical protein